MCPFEWPGDIIGCDDPTPAEVELLSLDERMQDRLTAPRLDVPIQIIGVYAPLALGDQFRVVFPALDVVKKHGHVKLVHVAFAPLVRVLNVIHVRVGRHDDDRLVGDALDGFAQVSDAHAGVNQHGPFGADQ